MSVNWRVSFWFYFVRNIRKMLSDLLLIVPLIDRNFFLRVIPTWNTYDQFWFLFSCLFLLGQTLVGASYQTISWLQIMSDSKNGSSNNLNESNMPLLDDVCISRIMGPNFFLKIASTISQAHLCKALIGKPVRRRWCFDSFEMLEMKLSVLNSSNC